MSERPKRIPQEIIRSAEDMERPPRYQTVHHEVLETYEDGSKTERVLECNGLHHRRCVDKISYDARGEIIFVDQLSREELGPCDGKHS